MCHCLLIVDVGHVVFGGQGGPILKRIISVVCLVIISMEKTLFVLLVHQVPEILRTVAILDVDVKMTFKLENEQLRVFTM